MQRTDAQPIQNSSEAQNLPSSFSDEIAISNTQNFPSAHDRLKVPADRDLEMKGFTQNQQQSHLNNFDQDKVQDNPRYEPLAAVYDLQSAFEEMGGFGRFQWLATLALIAARNSGNFLLYAFAYLTLEQYFECRIDPSQPFVSCSPEKTICPILDGPSATASKFEYRVDTSYEYYLDNWYGLEQMNLVCASHASTNSIVSAYYITFGVAGFLFHTMPKKFGLKNSMNANLFVHLIAQYVIVFFPSYWVRFLAFAVLGFAQLKHALCYVWIADLVPLNRNNACSIAMTSLDSSTMASVCFYFLFISQDWFPLMLLMTVVGTLALLTLIFVLPQSPAELIRLGRVDEAIDALNFIGRFNGVNSRIPRNAVFQETQGNVSLAKDASLSVALNDVQAAGEDLIISSRGSLAVRASYAAAVNESAVEVADGQQPAQSAKGEADWKLILLLTIIFSAVSNCYWLTIYNVINLPGNKFINGMMLGTADLSAGVFTGIVITNTDTFKAMHILGIVAIAFQSMSQFAPLSNDSIFRYVAVFVNILGVGGLYTDMFVLVTTVMPWQHLASAMIIILTVGNCLSLTAPLLAICPPPVPYIVLTTLALVTMIGTWKLERYHRHTKGNKDSKDCLKNKNFGLDTVDTATERLTSQ